MKNAGVSPAAVQDSIGHQSAASDSGTVATREICAFCEGDCRIHVKVKMPPMLSSLAP